MSQCFVLPHEFCRENNPILASQPAYRRKATPGGNRNCGRTCRFHKNPGQIPGGIRERTASPVAAVDGQRNSPGRSSPRRWDEAVRRQRVADVDELSRRRVSATDGRRLLHEARSPARPTQPARRGQPLQPATVRARRSKLLPRRGPILERSGDLASRILADWDDSSAVAGTNVVYAATHHFGDPRRGIPARPFLGVSADARDAILQAIVDHLVR